jgi:S-(hydroxymethyl)glutathione dehydrogenase / alcohol dehydrogenase
LNWPHELPHPDGKTILVGVSKKGDNVSIYTLPIHFNKILKGTHGGSCIPHIGSPRYIRLIHAGRMTLDGLITYEFKLDEINQGAQLLKAGNAGRIVISMGQ